MKHVAQSQLLCLFNDGAVNTALLLVFLLKIRSVRILDTIVCSGSLVLAVLSGLMFDNFLPIPDAESLPFYPLVLKLVVRVCVCTSSCASAESFSAPVRSICFIIRHRKETLGHLLHVFVNQLHCIITEGQQGNQGRLGQSCKVKALSFAIAWLE